MKQIQRTQEIEGELEQLREDAENAKFNMEQFGLDSYSSKQIHQWKEYFEDGLAKVRNYSGKYLQAVNDVSMIGINARKSVLGCIDYLAQEVVGRIKLREGRK